MMSTVQAQVIDTHSMFEAQVQDFQAQLSQLEVDTIGDRNEQIAHVEADFMNSLTDSGIDGITAAAELQKMDFLNGVQSVLSAQFTELKIEVLVISL